MSTKDVGDVKKSDSGGTDETVTKPVSEDKVSYETHRKLLSEKKKLDDKIEALAKELENQKLSRDAEEEKKLEEAKNLKGLLELKQRREKELQDSLEKTRQENTHLKKTFEESLKMDAILSNTTAPIKKKFWQLIETDKIVLDENGKPDLNSVKEVVKAFEEQYPEALDLGRSTQTPATSAGKPGKGTITVEEWARLPLKEKKERLSDVMSSLNK